MGKKAIEVITYRIESQSTGAKHLRKLDNSYAFRTAFQFRNRRLLRPHCLSESRL